MLAVIPSLALVRLQNCSINCHGSLPVTKHECKWPCGSCLKGGGFPGQQILHCPCVLSYFRHSRHEIIGLHALISGVHLVYCTPVQFPFHPTDVICITIHTFDIFYDPTFLLNGNLMNLFSPNTTANRSSTKRYPPKSVPHTSTLWNHRSSFEEPI